MRLVACIAISYTCEEAWVCERRDASRSYILLVSPPPARFRLRRYCRRQSVLKHTFSGHVLVVGAQNQAITMEVCMGKPGTSGVSSLSAQLLSAEKSSRILPV